MPPLSLLCLSKLVQKFNFARLVNIEVILDRILWGEQIYLAPASMQYKISMEIKYLKIITVSNLKSSILQWSFLHLGDILV